MELKALYLGIIQGLTEFLPISSSGHLLIFEEILGMDKSGSLMEIVLHGGTLVSIIVYFWKNIVTEFNNIINKKFAFINNLILATLPAAIIGFLFKDKIDFYFYNNNSHERFLYISIAYFLCAIILYSSKFVKKHDNSVKLTLSIAMIIGCAQILALFPGVSRSGITITAALLLGINSKEAARFSLMLAIPIIFFAFISSLVQDSSKVIEIAPSLFVGFLVSAITGYYVISILIKVVEVGKFWMFSIYCFIISLILFMVYNKWLIL